MEHPDAQHPTPSPDAKSADASMGRADGRYRGPTGGERPHYRTYGVPVRVRRQRAYAAQHPARAPGISAPRRMLVTAFINRNFALLWWGQAVSSVGDYAWDTALVLWIATDLAGNQSWAPLAVSGAILAAAIPQIVVGPLAGVFVDRWDKRRTMIAMTAIQTVLAALLIVPVLGVALPGIGRAHISIGWLLGVTYADIFLLTSCAQFFLPAQLALIKDIVLGPRQDQAIEMTQAIQGLAVVIGPPVAAALVFGLGIQWALLLNAITFVLCVWATVAIQAPPSVSSLAPGEVGHFSREFAAGIRYVLRHNVLRTVLIAEILTWLGFGALQSLGYFFITENLHAPPSSYGWFGAIFGVGAIVGAILVTIFGRRIGLARVLWVALVTSGIFVATMAHLTSFGLAMLAAFLFGVTATAILISAGPLAIDATEKEFVGRVTAVINPVGRLAAFFSVIIAGSLVATVLRGFHATILGVEFDAVNIVFSLMGLLAVAGGIYTRLHLRDAIEVGQQDRHVA
jgi:MFS family permease